jgi:protein-S-isoprenylcysteine O-methyltransferase Ste14
VPFLDRRSRARPLIESAFVRLVATAGIVGICVAVAAILGTQSVAAWVIGLVVSVVSVVLAAILWSSRTL